MSIKLDRVKRNATWFRGARTHAAIVEQIPPALVAECPSRLLVLVGDAINRAYHAGRASTGAEVVDDCLWETSVGRLIPLAALRAIQVAESHQDSVLDTPDGAIRPAGNRALRTTTRSYTLDYTETF
jgi:hypothetical protein